MTSTLKAPKTQGWPRAKQHNTPFANLPRNGSWSIPASHVLQLTGLVDEGSAIASLALQGFALSSIQEQAQTPADATQLDLIHNGSFNATILHPISAFAAQADLQADDLFFTQRETSAQAIDDDLAALAAVVYKSFNQRIVTTGDHRIERMQRPKELEETQEAGPSNARQKRVQKRRGSEDEHEDRPTARYLVATNSIDTAFSIR